MMTFRASRLNLSDDRRHFLILIGWLRTVRDRRGYLAAGHGNGEAEIVGGRWEPTVFRNERRRGMWIAVVANVSGRWIMKLY
jgi:hypothetical protein